MRMPPTKRANKRPQCRLLATDYEIEMLFECACHRFALYINAPVTLLFQIFRYPSYAEARVPNPAD